MLAIASLATGFVVAAITPSHGLDADALGNLDVNDSHSTLDQAADDGALGQEGHSGHGTGSTSRNG
ncbi:hypothetical protein [Streptomyces spongiae]